MTQYKYLLKNIGILTLSSFATKLLGFLLVPIYTYVLSTEEYGIYDIMSAAVGLLLPILTVNIFEGVLRFALDKEADKKTVFTVGCRYILVGNILFVLMLVINGVFHLSSILEQYAILVFLLFFANSFDNFMTSIARGFDKITDISISSVLSSLVVIILNIFFLCIIKIGIRGYFLAYIIGPIVKSVYIFIRIKGWNYFITTISISKNMKNEMVRYSLPTIANAISWWINGLADRYIVIAFCGLSANGVYSVASKIPSILNILQGIFAQAWTLSAVKEFDRDDKNGFFAKVFSSYNAILVIGCSLIICFDKVLAYYLYKNDFYTAWKYVPFLTISIIFGALSGYAGSIFAAIKHSDYFAKCSGIGAITNIFLNIFMIQKLGPIGAAVSTAISYWIIYLISMMYLRKSMTLKVHLLRDNLSYLLLMLQSNFLISIEGDIMLYSIQILFLIIQLFLFREEIKAFSHMITCKFSNKGDVK